MKQLEALAAVLLLAAPARSEVTVFEVIENTTGSVLVYDETGSVPSRIPNGLQCITLLPIEFSGRSLLEEGLSGRPVRHTDIPGAARVVLPGRRGSLYRYQRDENGFAMFGYFVVRTDGNAERLYEITGTGSSGDEDPLPGHVAVAPDGSSFLVGTTLTAGGNLMEIEVGSASFEDRTLALGPLDFPAGGLRLLGSWGVALSQQGVLRFDRAPGASAALVSVPGAPLAYFGDGVVISADESTVAFVGGASASSAHVYVLRQSGAATQTTTQARALGGAGFLPDCSNGPTLALAPDGSRVAFRSEGSSSETWSSLTSPSAPPAFQITSSARFEDSLGETGVIGFLTPSLLVLSAGDEGENGPMERGDLFQVDLVSGGVINLTMTSGQTQTPYGYGWAKIDPDFWPLPDASGALIVQEHPGGPDELLMVFWSTGSVSSVLTEVDVVVNVSPAGSDLILEVVRDLSGSPRELWRLPFAGPGPMTLLARLDEEDELVARMSRSNGSLAVAVESGSTQFIGRSSTTTGSSQLPAAGMVSFGPTLEGDSSGTLFGSVGVSGRAYHFSWWNTGSFGVFGAAPESAFVLPGN